MARRSVSALLMALLAAGCVPAPASPPPASEPPSARRPAVPVAPLASVAAAPLISDKGLGVISTNGGALIGKVKMPAGLIANNGGGLISDKGGSLIANNGGGLISDKGLGYRTLAAEALPLEGFTVYVADAEGRAIPDPDGKPYTAVTDAQGAYRFAATPRGRNLVVRVMLPEGLGAMLAYMPDAAEGAAREVDVDGVSTIVMGYILDRFVKGDLEVLQKLPAEAEAETRRKAAAAMGEGFSLASFKPEDLVKGVDGLRAKDATFDAQVEYVERLLVAGLKDVGEGLEATRVSLTNPTTLLRLPDGSLLIGERNGHRVRRLKDGKITTFAGKDGAKLIGDGGPATEAWIDRPDGLGADAEGNVYVCDFGNALLRRIDAKTGIITTVAGLPSGVAPATGVRAVEAELSWPDSVVVDREGRPIVACAKGIFRVEADGTLRQLSAESPRHLALSPEGVLYGFDPDPGVFVRFDAAGQPFDAGLPTRKFTLSSGFAIGQDGSFYASGDGLLLKLSDGAWQPVAGAAALNLTASAGVLPEAEGLVVADSGANRIWRLPASGAPVLLAGLALEARDALAASELSLNRPIDLAFDKAGNLYVADGWNGFVWQRRADGKYYRFAGNERANAATVDIGDGGPAREAKFGNITSFALTRDGRMILTDAPYPLFRLREIAQDGTIRTLAPTGALAAPGVVAEAADGALLVSDFLLKKVLRIQDGQVSEAVRGGEVQTPMGILPMPDGSFYLADADKCAIFHVKDGTPTRIAGGNGYGFSGDGGPALSAQLNNPLELAMDAAGDLYVADSRNDRVRRIVLSTGVIETVAGAGSANQAGSTPDDSLKEPIGLAFDAEGNLYIADSAHNQIKLVPKDKLR